MGKATQLVETRVMVPVSGVHSGRVSSGSALPPSAHKAHPDLYGAAIMVSARER